MQDFGTKADNSPPPGGQLSAAEFNNLATENENAVLRSGNALSGASNTQLAESLFLHSVKSGSFQDSGSANAYVVTPISGASGVAIPATYAAAAGSVISFKAANTNTGASTLNIGQTTGTLIGVKPIRTSSDTALPTGSIVSGQRYQLFYNASFDSGNGAWEVMPWTTKTLFSQPGALNARMSIPAASASGTLTCEIVTVNEGIGGQSYHLTAFSQSINLATVGAGGMDTGAAPASGYVSIYAIYNPVVGTRALLACSQATSSGSVYTGANMPAGFTASALVSSWGTTAGALMRAGYLTGRKQSFASITVATATASTGSLVGISLVTAVPTNAKTFAGSFGMVNATTAAMGIVVAADTLGTDAQNVNCTSTQGTAPYQCSIITPQAATWQTTSGGGTPNFSVNVTSYTF